MDARILVACCLFTVACAVPVAEPDPSGSTVAGKADGEGTGASASREAPDPRRADWRNSFDEQPADREGEIGGWVEVTSVAPLELHGTLHTLEPGWIEESDDPLDVQLDYAETGERFGTEPIVRMVPYYRDRGARWERLDELQGDGYATRLMFERTEDGVQVGATTWLPGSAGGMGGRRDHDLGEFNAETELGFMVIPIANGGDREGGRLVRDPLRAGDHYPYTAGISRCESFFGC
jgi:hypothetical protein